MALIEFKNLPDTSTPINAENLNNNFNEMIVSGTTGTEMKTNIIIDNKPVYMKRIEIGAMPNTSSKTVNLGFNISTITILSCSGYMYNSGANYGWLIPNGDAATQVHLEFNGNNVLVITATNRSSYNGYLVLMYIKN